MGFTITMISPRRDRRFWFFVLVVLSLVTFLLCKTYGIQSDLSLIKAPSWLKPQGDQFHLPESWKIDEEGPSPLSISIEVPVDPQQSYITNTTIETVIPRGAHAPGFTVFDQLYLRAGIFYVVTSDVNSFPPRRYLISKPLEMSHGSDLEPTDQDLQFIHPSKAQQVLGDFAMRVPGLSVIVHDPSQFMHHYYHWWGEVILGFWRVYSHLSEAPDKTHSALPFPSRFILSVIEREEEWRDRAGVDGPLMRAAFPMASIEKAEYWRDLIKLNTTVAFDRSMIINRHTAHKHPYGSRWFKMIAGTMDVTVADDFWAPVRKSLVENLLGYVPVLDTYGAVVGPNLPAGVTTTKPIVTYISRQGAGRRLTDKDHEGLVAALRSLESEGLCEVYIPMMERMALQEQIALPAKSTIIVGVHGNGMTHQIWMPPSSRSTVIEIFDPPSYAFDYEMLARNMGHRHYGVNNDTLLTYPKGEYHEGVHFTKGFHGNEIPVYGPAIAEAIRERLTGPIP